MIVAFYSYRASSNHKGKAFENNSHMYATGSIICPNFMVIFIYNTIKGEVFEEQKDNSKTCIGGGKREESFSPWHTSGSSF